MASGLFRPSQPGQQAQSNAAPGAWERLGGTRVPGLRASLWGIWLCDLPRRGLTGLRVGQHTRVYMPVHTCTHHHTCAAPLCSHSERLSTYTHSHTHTNMVTPLIPANSFEHSN